MEPLKAPAPTSKFMDKHRDAVQSQVTNKRCVILAVGTPTCRFAEVLLKAMNDGKDDKNVCC